MQTNSRKNGSHTDRADQAAKQAEPLPTRVFHWWHRKRFRGTAKLPVVAGALAVLLIVAGFWTQLALHTRPPALGSGPWNATPSPAVTIVPTPSTTTTTTPSVTATVGSSSTAAASATILIQTKRIHFRTASRVDPSEIIIDPSDVVLIATDGTGQVAGFVKTFTVIPPLSSVPNASGLPAPEDTTGPQPAYYVPSDCASQVAEARSNAILALSNQIDNYERSTDLDVQELLTSYNRLSTYVYDPTYIACSPGPGYRQSTPFNYMVVMKASANLALFRLSDVLAYRKQQAIAHAPSNYIFEQIDGTCDNQFIQPLSNTAVKYRCGVMGYYRWNWTPQIGRILASQIAGKDPATARNILAAYAGADIYNQQGISFTLVGGTTLPSDPAKITFKVYDSVLVGVNDIQTAGIPQIVP